MLLNMRRSILAVLCLLLYTLGEGGQLLAQQWTIDLPNRAEMHDGLIRDDNSFLMVGGYEIPEDSCSNGIMVLFNDNGQHEFKFFPSGENRHLLFESIHQLPNGGYFVVGYSYVFDFPTRLGDLIIMTLDDDMNVTSQQTFQAEDFDGFDGSCSVMDDDGTIVVLATARRPRTDGGTDYNGVLFRFTPEGELLHCRYLVADPPDPLAYIHQIRNMQIANDPHTDHTVALGDGHNGIPSLLVFDHEFNLLEYPYLLDPSIPDTVMHYIFHRHVFYPRSDYWYNGDELLVSGHQGDTTQGVHNHPHLLVGRVNLQGEVLQKAEVLKQDTLLYNMATAYANDSTVYVAARCHTVSWTVPYYPHLYLFSTGLELLGRVELWDHLDHFPIFLLPAPDGGCFAFLEKSRLYYDDTQPMVVRFSREDFHPVPVAVQEVPASELQAIAFPNPSEDILNIDISNLPHGKEHRVRIADSSGRPCLDRVIHGEGNLLTLDIGSLPIGIYHYSVYHNGTTALSGKFVKK